MAGKLTNKNKNESKAMDADEWENIFGKIDEDTTNVAAHS